MILLVGAGRFERPTPCAQGRCATRLRYAPTCGALLILNYLRNPYPLENRSQPQNVSNCIKTTSHCTFTVSKPLASLACRLINLEMELFSFAHDLQRAIVTCLEMFAQFALGFVPVFCTCR